MVNRSSFQVTNYLWITRYNEQQGRKKFPFYIYHFQVDLSLPVGQSIKMAPDIKVPTEHDRNEVCVGNSDHSETKAPTVTLKQELNVPLDQVDTNRMGTFGTYLVAGISLAIYGYSLYALYVEYSTTYFHKITDSDAVPNYLRSWSPLYLVAILFEGFMAYLKGKPVYTTGDTFCSMLTFGLRGVFQRLLSMVRSKPKKNRKVQEDFSITKFVTYKLWLHFLACIFNFTLKL